MQQPANMSGVQVIVLAQTAPIDTQNRYRNMTSELADKFNTLGKAHILIGILCIIFQIVRFGFSNHSVGHGIWIGSLFIVTGGFGIVAGKKGGKCQVITFQVLSIISAGFALLLFCIAVPFAAMSYRVSDGNSAGNVVAMEVLLTLMSLAEGAVAIYSSVTGCTIGLCCCDCGGSCCCPTDPQYHQFVNPVLPDLAQQQFIAGNQQQPMLNTNQQQPVFNPNQQQPMFNPNQQQPVFNPNQQQPMLNTNQQQPVFNPNQQQPVFNPNQQQLLMFNPNQQQLMFNPTQQQLMFNPNQQQTVLFATQPMAGFYPQQYAVQHQALQPNVSPKPPQPTISASLPETTGQGTHTVEYTGLAAAPLPTDSNTQPIGERSHEGLIRFSESEMSSPQEPPPPYDNDSGWNSHI